MNRYKSLAQNTAILAMGTFGSKILSFIMVFFYSRAMQTAEFGVLDIIINSASLMLPIAMLGINNGLVRFGLDPKCRQSDVFTTGLCAVAIGFSALLIISPLIMKIDDLRQYIFLLYAYVLMSSLRHVCSYFVRSDNKLKLFSIDGIFSTFMTCLLTIIFLIPLNMGIRGYLLAVILADFSSVIFLTFFGKLLPYVDFKGLDRRLTKRMIKFSVPLIPTSLLWWIINVSDRYFVKYMIGAEANGLYSVAYKIPTVLTLVSAIFLDAWQISAVTENESRSRSKFYSDIFASFEGAIFIVSSALILFAKIITKILLAPDYYESWKYIPVLMLATVFSCFVVFLGNIYLAERRSISTMLTTVAGALINLVLNFFLIPQFGPNGAATATCISYFAVFAIRTADIKHRNRDMKFSLPMVAINSALTVTQIIIMLAEPPNWVIYQILCLAAITALNIKMLIKIIKKIMKKEGQGRHS